MQLIQEMISVRDRLLRYTTHGLTLVRMLVRIFLLGQMSRIREKATESEAVVRDITKDIRMLDTARRI